MLMSYLQATVDSPLEAACKQHTRGMGLNTYPSITEWIWGMCTKFNFVHHKSYIKYYGNEHGCLSWEDGILTTWGEGD
jgi:hypothetical protein